MQIAQTLAAVVVKMHCHVKQYQVSILQQQTNQHLYSLFIAAIIKYITTSEFLT